MQKNITFKPTKEQSERGNRKNDSSSFIKNNTSSEFKMPYDKTFNSSTHEMSKALTVNNKEKAEKSQSKPRNIDSQLKELLRKWKEANFLSSSFTQVIKNLPVKP